MRRRRKYTVGTMTAPVPWLSTAPRTERATAASDDSRRHAINWFIALFLTGLAVLVTVWFVLAMWGIQANWLFKLWPLALIASIVKSCERLLHYTAEYRKARYNLPAPAKAEKATAATPRPRREFTGLWAADGSIQRIDGMTLNNAEIKRLKQVLLREGKYVTRNHSQLLGQRASILRGELYRLGITTEPVGNRATQLTAKGRAAVEKW